MAQIERSRGGTQTILVVEDDASIRDVIATALRHHGYAVSECRNGDDGLQLALTSPYALVVLDVMLPAIDGFEVCRRLRSAGKQTPVLFLSARGETADRVHGFVNGGDDYLVKPFSVDELILRVASILRRSAPQGGGTQLMVGDLLLDRAACEVRRGDATIELSPTEFALLDYLMVNTGIVVSKAQILANVWPDDFTGSYNVVELYIGYLRRKVDVDRPPLIHTRRGLGYVLRPVGR
jgi:two-component system, OmpR family, response regulator